MSATPSIKALAAVCGLAFAAQASAQNIFVNGGFEDITGTGVTPTTSVSVGGGGQPALPGWTTALSAGGTSPNNYLYGTNLPGPGVNGLPTPVAAGTYALQLGTNFGGSTGAYAVGNQISQVVSGILPFTPYQFSFAFRGEIGQPGSATLTIIIQDALAQQAPQTTFVTVDASNWQTISQNIFFTTAGDYRFTFIDGATSVNTLAGSNPNNVSLDNITLTGPQAPIPELTTWIGFALLAGGALSWQNRKFLRGLFAKVPAMA